jgi:hypothetical protein
MGGIILSGSVTSGDISNGTGSGTGTSMGDSTRVTANYLEFQEGGT